MKLLVIVLCLFSERFFVHVSSHRRFHWFTAYGKAIEQRFARVTILSFPWMMLVVILLPVLLVCGLAYYIFSDWLFGFVGLALNIIIFYYCIGPGNPFYPVRATTTENTSDEIGTYLVNVNSQLFAVLFWYIILGPFAVLFYRLISLCQNLSVVGQIASWLTNVLEWMPARMTVLLYLLVGNFQAGLRNFSKLLFSLPVDNETLLGVCGPEALISTESEPMSMPQAESLVEHSVILLLVFLAVFTLVAWV